MTKRILSIRTKIGLTLGVLGLLGLMLAGCGVVIPGIAAFTASPTAGIAPLTVQFTDQSTGTPVSWLWDFGDGTTSAEQNPSHKYTAAGIYTVSLTVSYDVLGTSTETKTNYIKVGNTGVGVPGATHTTIGGAVGAAPPGGIVVVGPGTYTENVTIDKAGLKLVAGSRPIIDGDLTVNADNVTIQGFEVTGVLETTAFTSFANLTLIDTLIYGQVFDITLSCDDVVNPGDIIQNSINGAPPGALICVAPGTYNEQLTINKSLTLRGFFNPTLDLTGFAQYGIRITAANVTVDGFIVENLTQVVATGPAGIFIDHADDVVIKNCIVRNNNALGILAWQSDRAQLLNNIAYNNNQWTLDSTTHAASGISVTMDPGKAGPVGAVVSGNTIYNNQGWGIGLGCGVCTPANPPSSNASNIQVTGNTIYGNWFAGIGMAYVNNSNISNNVIHDNGQKALTQDGSSFAFDIVLSESDGNLIKDNNIYGSKDPTAALRGGIGIGNSDNNTIESNYIHDEAGTGIVLSGTTGTEVHFNNIQGNGYGLDNSINPTETVDAENNWWGDASGPYDPNGTVEVTPTTCQPNPADDKNADGTGDAVSDNVDYCPWATAAF